MDPNARLQHSAALARRKSLGHSADADQSLLSFPFASHIVKSRAPLPHMLLWKPVLNPLMWRLFFEDMKEVGTGNHHIYHPSPTKKKPEFMICCLINTFLGERDGG